MTEQEQQRYHCRNVLLPIWERWTEGNPALGRFLDGMSADPASRVERLYRLVTTTETLRRQGQRASVRAALLAASACVQGYLPLPDAPFWTIARAAPQAHQTAEQQALGPMRRSWTMANRFAEGGSSGQ